MPEERIDAVDATAQPDPVRAVLDAHRQGRRVLLRTSGTTSVARSLVRTTRSWFDSFPYLTDLLEAHPGSRVWIPGPLSATMNLFAAVHTAHIGATVVHDPAEATHAHLTPAVALRLLAQEPSTLDGTHVVVAGDSLDERLHERLSRHARAVGHYYGAAELSLVAWGAHAAALRAFPEVEIEQRDGELWVRSPYVSDGYLRADGSVGDAGPLRTDAAGWTTVGDRGSYVDGAVAVAGRGGAAVTTAGATVALADVEPVLRTVASAQLWLVGLAHAQLGEVLVAVLGDAGDHEAVRAHARQTLPASHRPRRWFQLVAQVPLTGAGKLDRAALAELVASGDGVRRLG